MTSNYDVSTNLEIFYFCIFADYEANIAPISTNFFLFSYKFDMGQLLMVGASQSRIAK